MEISSRWLVYCESLVRNLSFDIAKAFGHPRLRYFRVGDTRSMEETRETWHCNHGLFLCCYNGIGVCRSQMIKC